MASNCIVVGVDGSAGARSALLWAADECALRRRTLVVVHAPFSARSAVVELVDDAAVRLLEERGEKLLAEHAAAASSRQPGVLVTNLLSKGAAADALIDLSADAELVVVGTHGRGGIVSSILGSVSHRVATHAHCPVAVVPERPPLRTAEPAPRVVVGVSSAKSGRIAFDFAIDEARRRGATLVAVRAWGEPDSSLLAEIDTTVADRWKTHAGRDLQNDLAALAGQLPDVVVEPVLASAEPAQALLHAARTAQLIVVGCHHSEDRWSTRLGPVPSAILHRSPCPVIVVGERAHDSAPATRDSVGAPAP
jgi:nucleotide-binding universal stress UspA family protein